MQAQTHTDTNSHKYTLIRTHIRVFPTEGDWGESGQSLKLSPSCCQNPMEDPVHTHVMQLAPALKQVIQGHYTRVLQGGGTGRFPSPINRKLPNSPTPPQKSTPHYISAQSAKNVEKFHEKCQIFLTFVAYPFSPQKVGVPPPP